ncbi:Hypothetical predicted protein [Paramuricea clavata]|uniref:Uncharacterized protein n=1 Tax=Paramuricea clavata TaxID=317549 RepID=A0A7D9DSA9_PARCT|nr:Hypothetical predicted protein [Paramuricea clavata]
MPPEKKRRILETGAVLANPLSGSGIRAQRRHLHDPRQRRVTGRTFRDLKYPFMLDRSCVLKTQAEESIKCCFIRAQLFGIDGICSCA